MKQKYFLTHSGSCQIRSYLEHFGADNQALVDLSASFLPSIAEKVEKIFPDLDVEILNLSELQSELVEMINEKVDLTKNFIVSIEDEWIGIDGYKLEMCRAQMRDGSNAGYCPRPGHMPLNDQYAEIVRRCADKDIILMDDGLFSGNTIQEIILQLKERGKENFSVYVQVATKDAIDAFHSAGIEVYCVRSLDIPKDWVCERDLRFGIARTGKPIVNGNNDPMKIEREGIIAYFCKPYPLPTGDLGSSASIPPEYVTDLSRFILDWHIELFDQLEQTVGPVRLSVLPELSALHSIPLHDNPPPLDKTMVEYLHELRSKI